LLRTDSLVTVRTSLRNTPSARRVRFLSKPADGRSVQESWPRRWRAGLRPARGCKLAPSRAFNTSDQMRGFQRRVGVAALLGLAACATGSPSDRAGPRPGEPSAETQRVTFALIKSTLECFGKHRPVHPGKVILVGVFSAPGSPLEVFDSDSTPGNE